jgi:hypothetical protein
MAAIKRELQLEFLIFLLAAAFWVATPPVSSGVEFAPADLIENALPRKTTLKRAKKADFLGAVCSAVRANRKAAAGITSAAVTARPALARDIVGAVLRCTRKYDCEYAGAIAGAAFAANPAAATVISDAAIARAPDCGDTIAAATRPATTTTTAATAAAEPGPTAAEERFDPLEPLKLVCTDGIQRAIRASLVDEFLRAHPDSYLGSCPPETSPGRSATPFPPVPRWATPSPAPQSSPSPSPAPSVAR